MANTPITDVSLARLYRAITGITPLGLPLTESQETQRQHEAVIAEIEDYRETEKVKRLARAVEVPFDDRPAPTDSELLRLYKAVR